MLQCICESEISSNHTSNELPRNISPPSRYILISVCLFLSISIRIRESIGKTIGFIWRGVSDAIGVNIQESLCVSIGQPRELLYPVDPSAVENIHPSARTENISSFIVTRYSMTCHAVHFITNSFTQAPCIFPCILISNKGNLSILN